MLHASALGEKTVFNGGRIDEVNQVVGDAMNQMEFRTTAQGRTRQEAPMKPYEGDGMGVREESEELGKRRMVEEAPALVVSQTPLTHEKEGTGSLDARGVQRSGNSEN